MPELKDIKNSLKAIAKHMSSLENSVTSHIRRQHSGLLSGSKVMEKHREGIRESRREQREERQLDNTANQNLLLKQQNKLLLFTLIVTATSAIGALIVNIINTFLTK